MDILHQTSLSMGKTDHLVAVEGKGMLAIPGLVQTLHSTGIINRHLCVFKYQSQYLGIFCQSFWNKRSVTSNLHKTMMGTDLICI